MLVPVSVIIPVYNEAAHIVPCLESLVNGTYPAASTEFLVVDGGSKDDTVDRLQSFARSNPDLRLRILHNPDKTQGYALNVAIGNLAPESKLVIRADGHSTYPPDYLSACVATSLATDAENVGGAMVPVGKTPLQEAIAFCMSHPLGVGNARFHLADFNGEVDTVYLGCFKREVFDKVGFFDPHLTPNEDAEFNLRIRKTGGRIYLNSAIQVDYLPRESLATLARQYFNYGRGRCRTVRKHRVIPSSRQLIPPVWLLFSILCVVFTAVSAWWLIMPILYLATCIAVAALAAIQRKNGALFLAPICFVIMHYSWGSGFLYELAAPLKNIQTGRL